MKTLLPALLLIPSLCFADISFGTGEAKDCELAKALAVRDALESYAGAEFDYTKKQSCIEKNDKQDCSFQKDMDVDTGGTLKRIISENVKKQKDGCIVETKIEVEISRSLYVTFDGDSIFEDGEPLKFRVFAGEPVYFYLFVNGKKPELIFPSEEVGLTNNLIDGEFVFPGKKGVNYVLFSESGDSSKEQYVLLFSKQKLFDKRKWSNYKLSDIIKSIPTFSRKVIYYDVQIQRRY